MSVLQETQPLALDQWQARRRAGLWLVGACLVGLVVTVAFFGWGSAWGLKEHALGIGFDLAAAALGVILCVLVLGWASLRSKLDLFELPIWLSVNVYGQVVLNVWLLQRDRLPTVPWLRYNYQTSMVWAVVAIGVGLLATWLGYFWAHARGAAPRAPARPQQNTLRSRAALALWLVGWVPTMFFTFTGQLGYLTPESTVVLVWANYLQFLNLVSALGATGLIIQHFRAPRPAGWVWLAFMLASTLVASLVVGSKSFVLTLVWLIMCIYYASGRLPLRLIALGAALTVFLVPVVNLYRVNLHLSGDGRGVAIPGRLVALSGAVDVVQEQSVGTLVENLSDTFEARQGTLLDVTASVLVLHPATLPYMIGDFGEYLAVQLVPRAIWPGKPDPNPMLFDIRNIYLGVRSEFGLAAIGLFGDSYRGGGWIFLVVWFLLLGWFGAWLYRRGPGGGDTAGTVFYIVLVNFVFIYEGDVTATMLRLVQFTPFFWLLVTRVLYKRPQPLPQDIT